MDRGCVPVRDDGCTGTAIDFGSFSANPRLGFGVFVGGVPVRGPVYRYAEADFEQFETAGVFLQCGFPICVPTTPRALPELRAQEKKPFPPLLKLGAWFWWIVEGRSWDLKGLELGLRLLREPSELGEARDRGKGIASG
uniref:Uncharacterized protein n=1 Tax=Ananas comosus var. bracteatus TaxID=296719 RepID=A0A6V7PZS8_ANACO|nr:unnamed protein product [Ananas comosus var. bracteatus]